jgi:predicted transcriptional regulator
VRALAERGAGALTEPLARVMTRKISTCTQSDAVNSIMEQMTADKFRHVPVVEEERLVGIVSIGDVVKHTLMGMKLERGGPGCLRKNSASLSRASAEVRLPCGVAAG